MSKNTSKRRPVEDYARLVIDADNRFYEAQDNEAWLDRTFALQDLRRAYWLAESAGYTEREVLEAVYKIDEAEGTPE